MKGKGSRFCFARSNRSDSFIEHDWIDRTLGFFNRVDPTRLIQVSNAVMRSLFFNMELLNNWNSEACFLCHIIRDLGSRYKSDLLIPQHYLKIVHFTSFILNSLEQFALHFNCFSSFLLCVIFWTVFKVSVFCLFVLYLCLPYCSF